MARWYTSDLHLGHANIIQYCNRPFLDLLHHDEGLVENWNALVGADDDVYVVGDLCMGHPREWPARVAPLRGRIHLVTGNHDQFKTYQNRALFPGIVEVVKAVTLEVEGWRWRLRHYPPHQDTRPVPADVDAYVHGHTHSHLRGRVRDGLILLHVGVDAWAYAPVPEAALVECMGWALRDREATRG